MLAFAIIVSALQGDESDPVGKSEATTEGRGANASPPPPSTEAAS